MLDDFCQSLSNTAQLEIALELLELALPVWTEHFAAHPDAIDAVNRLYPEQRPARAAPVIHVKLPAYALAQIRESYAAARAVGERQLILTMRSDAALEHYVHTFMLPLTNPVWESTLPHSVQLVFTSLWNLLNWLRYRRMADTGETHVYIAINQAADVLLSEKICTNEDLNAVLAKYADRKKSAIDDEENALLDVPAKADENRVFAKIIRPTAGVPCCPQCASQNVGEVFGVADIGQMRCDDCGYEQYCDAYEIGDWYR